MCVLAMLKYEENNGTEEIGLVTTTPDPISQHSDDVSRASRRLKSLTTQHFLAVDQASSKGNINFTGE